MDRALTLGAAEGLDEEWQCCCSAVGVRAGSGDFSARRPRDLRVGFVPEAKGQATNCHPTQGFSCSHCVCHDGVCQCVCGGVVEAMTLSSAPWLLDLGAGQAAPNLNFVPCFPHVALEPMPGGSSGSPDPGTQQEAPLPSPGDSPQLTPGVAREGLGQEVWGLTISENNEIRMEMRV